MGTPPPEVFVCMTQESRYIAVTSCLRAGQSGGGSTGSVEAGRARGSVTGFSACATHSIGSLGGFGPEVTDIRSQGVGRMEEEEEWLQIRLYVASLPQESSPLVNPVR